MKNDVVVVFNEDIVEKAGKLNTHRDLIGDNKFGVVRRTMAEVPTVRSVKTIVDGKEYNDRIPSGMRWSHLNTKQQEVIVTCMVHANIDTFVLGSDTVVLKHHSMLDGITVINAAKPVFGLHHKAGACLFATLLVATGMAVAARS